MNGGEVRIAWDDLLLMMDESIVLTNQRQLTTKDERACESAF